MKISQKIIDYALWYYCKYYPSKKKLKEKLLLKFGKDSENGKKYGGIGEEEILYIFDEKMKPLFCETAIIEAKVLNYKAKNKSMSYVKQKLFEKGFEKEDYEPYISQLYQDGEQKSIQAEFQKIYKTVSFEQAKAYFLEESFDLRQKKLQKLLRKGFRYQDILSLL